MATELKFSVLFQAVDYLSDKLSSIGGGISDLGEHASEGGERISSLGEGMVGFGEKLSLVTAVISEGASKLHEWTEALSEPAMAMEKAGAMMAAMTDLNSKGLAEMREHAVAFSNTNPGTTSEQWMDGARRLYGVYHDTAKAMNAEDIAAKFSQLGLDQQSAIRLLTVGQTAYGVSAKTMGDQLIRTMKAFPLVNDNAQQFTATIGRLAGFAATSKTPLRNCSRSPARRRR